VDEIFDIFEGQGDHVGLVELDEHEVVLPIVLGLLRLLPPDDPHILHDHILHFALELGQHLVHRGRLGVDLTQEEAAVVIMPDPVEAIHVEVDLQLREDLLQMLELKEGDLVASDGQCPKVKFLA